MQSKYKEYTGVDPELDAIAEQLPNMPPSAPITVGLIRSAIGSLVKMKSEAEPAVTNIDVQDATIPVKDGEIMLRKYIPHESVPGGLNPLMVWYHGGGYILGHPVMDDDFCRLTSVTQNITIVSVDYRLAPEHPFPAGVEDSYTALKWCADHTKELKVDTTKGFLVGGASSGGNFASVLSLMARDDPKFTAKLTGQVLLVPLICATCIPDQWKADLQSINDIMDAPVLPRKMIDLFMESYGCTDESDIRRSPLLAASFAGLPRAVIQVAGNDPLRDEGILYAKLLEKNGVETKVSIYPGAFHGFYKLAPQAKSSIQCNKNIQDGIKWLLSVT